MTLVASALVVLAAGCSSGEPPSCQGTAVQCSAIRNPLTCEPHPFCHFQSSECAGYPNEVSCGPLPKEQCKGGFCQWSDATSTCTGTTKCRSVSDGPTCQALPLCEWRPGECMGPVLACEPLRQEDCVTTEGCDWR